MIVVDRLEKSYGCKAVLRDLSFSAAAGQITLLVGPNGAGKTTTLKILAGLVRPSAGCAGLNGFDIVRDRRRAQSAASYLPQRPDFHPRLTVREIGRFYARLRGVAFSCVENLLAQMDLRTFARTRAGELSGGTKQRLGLAILLLPNAPILLLDEPGLSLDPAWRKRLQTILENEAARGKAILVTTHLIAEWNDIAQRCLLCRDGRVERELDPQNLPNDFDELRASEQEREVFASLG